MAKDDDDKPDAKDEDPSLDMSQTAVKRMIADAEARLAGSGRVLIRKSGTEPLIRVMAEGDDAAQVERIVDSICDAVQAAT